MKTLAVFGDEDFVLGFRLAGVKQSVATPDPEAFDREVNAALADRGIGIVVVDAKDVDRASPSLKRRISASVDPVVVALGGAGGGDLREKIKRAIGIDLYKD